MSDITVTSVDPMATTTTTFAEAVEAYNNGAFVGVKLNYPRYGTIIMALEQVLIYDDAILAMIFYANGSGMCVYFCDDGNIYAVLPDEYQEALYGDSGVIL